MKYTILEVDLLKDKKSKRNFIDLPFKLYQDEKSWVPPLKISLDELINIKHPFFKTSMIKAWLLFDENQIIVGRIMAIINKKSMEFHQDKCGFFGFLACIEDGNAFKLLLDSAANYLKEEGIEEMRGPVDPSTNYECGTLIDGFKDPAQIMMTYNFPYYDQYIKKSGLKKEMDLLAYKVETSFTMPPLFEKISKRAEKSSRITYRTLDKKNWDKEIENLFEIYNCAWEKNWGFIPMSKDEFIHSAKDMKMIFDERLVLIAEVYGKPAGFIIALPDYNQVFKRIPSGKLLPTGIFKILFAKKKVSRVRVLTMGLRPEYRKLGLASLLYFKCHQEIKKAKQYKEIEMSWILETNRDMNKPLETMNAEIYKKYRIYSKALI